MTDGNGPPKPTEPDAHDEEKFRAGALSEAFFADPEERAKHGIPINPDEPTDVVVELNLFHEHGLSGSWERLEKL